jgi:thioredoxin-related protein
MAEVKWLNDLGTGLEAAKAQKKPTLLDFFNPGWIGCKQMGAVTYPDNRVAEFLNSNVVPVQLIFDSQPYATDYNIKWTPTILILDTKGREHHRVVGFLPPDEFIPAMLLGIGKMYFDLDQINEAITELDKVLNTYPQSSAAPEAVYLKGVAGYKSTHTAQPLKAAEERLKKEYPASEWAKRAMPYQLL